METVKESALALLKKEFSILPMQITRTGDKYEKKPALNSWKEYQKRFPTKEEIEGWFKTDDKDLGVAIITGQVSNLVVLDFESGFDFGVMKEKGWNLPDTLISKTPSGGKHYYYRPHPDKSVPRNAVRVHNLLLDVRGEGGFVGAPPTTGYDWVTEEPLAKLPDWVYEAIKNTSKIDWKVKSKETIYPGSRNDTLASFTGKILRDLDSDLWEVAGWGAVKEWNLSHNKPPLGEKEVRATYESVASLELASKESSGNTPKISIPNALEFANQEFGDAEWLVQDLIPMGGSTIFVAKRESYKTWLALYFSHRISKGLPLWDKFQTKKSSVLYISNDDPVVQFKNRLEQFTFGDSFFIYHQALPPFSIEQGNGSFESVKSLIREKGISVLFVDILRNTHNKDSNIDKDAKLVFDRYKELREYNPNLVFVFLIHPSKESTFEKKYGKRQVEEAVGSYYWEASVDTVLSLTKNSNEELTDEVYISVTKNKQSGKKLRPFVGIKKRLDESIKFEYEEKLPEKLKLQQAEEFILNSLSNGDLERQKLIELAVEANICASRTAEEALKNLFTKSQVYHTISKPHIYSLKPIEDSANRNSTYTVRNAESEEEGGTPELFTRRDL